MSASHMLSDRNSGEEVSGTTNRINTLFNLTRYQRSLAAGTANDLNHIGNDLILRLNSNLSPWNDSSNYNWELSYFKTLFDKENRINDDFKIKAIYMLISLIELKLAVFATRNAQAIFEDMLNLCVENSQELLNSHQLQIQQITNYYALNYSDKHYIEIQSFIQAIQATSEGISDPSPQSLIEISQATSNLERLMLDSRNDKILLGMVGGLCLVGGIVASILLSPCFGVLAGMGAFLIYQAHQVKKQEAAHKKHYDTFHLFAKATLAPLISSDQRKPEVVATSNRLSRS